MENYYKRIEVLKESDLPKETGAYFGCESGFKGIVSLTPLIDRPELTLEHSSMRNIRWYLQPITSEEYQKQVEFEAACNPDLIEAQTNYKLYQEKIEALEELCAKQKELIMFYGKNIGDKAVYLSIHGISDSDEDIKKGEELRQKISELESKLKGV
jgi:hypothetical protein